MEIEATHALCGPGKLSYSGSTTVVELGVNPEHHRAMTPRMRTAFWKTVTDCLVEFYGEGQQEASARVSELRSRLSAEEEVASRKRNRLSDQIYHSEPIHIAADLTGKEPVRHDKFYARYLQIQKRNLRATAGTKPTSVERKKVGERSRLLAAVKMAGTR
jgi:hypothetical protein